MKMIQSPNKQIIKLLERIHEADAIELFTVKNGDWKKEYFTQGCIFMDFKIWIRKNFNLQKD